MCTFRWPMSLDQPENLVSLRCISLMAPKSGTSPRRTQNVFGERRAVITLSQQLPHSFRESFSPEQQMVTYVPMQQAMGLLFGTMTPPYPSQLSTEVRQRVALEMEVDQQLLTEFFIQTQAMVG